VSTARQRLFSFCLPVLSLLFLQLSVGVDTAAAAASSQADTAEHHSVLQNITYVSASDYTRIVISLSEKVRHKLFMAPADPGNGLPARLVVDFAPTRKGPRAPLSLSIQDGLLTQVRTGQFSLTTVRVVLDIESINDYKTFSLQEPYRLIIDVRGRVKRKTPPPTVTEKPEPTFTIMLDPGHGGKDPGAIGEGRVSEKDVVLAISKRLGRKLTGRLPVNVLYTRTTDVFVPLEERIARANAAKADVFVSIHVNASTNTDLQGVETYYLNNTNDRATIRLAALENGVRPGRNNKTDGEAGLSYLLSDLIQGGKEEDSMTLARHLQDAIITRAKDRYPAVRNLGVKKGPFYVLVGAHMPCVLVETAFITHRVEGKYLSKAEYRETLAEGLFLGIARFLRTGRMGKNL
jgi:N-acetylmuramoyl-L-alanine amidase